MSNGAVPNVYVDILAGYTSLNIAAPSSKLRTMREARQSSINKAKEIYSKTNNKV